MILNDQQRDALITEITGTIRDNERTKVLFLDELVTKLYIRIRGR